MSASSGSERQTIDVVLSSGFLGFSRHLGFLRCVEDRGAKVEGVLGTSSGALVGALWAAGHSAEWIAKELYEPMPLRSLRVSRTPWRGIFHMNALLHRLQKFLPAAFEDLERTFAVGVTGPNKVHQLVHSGPLLPALEASCAVPVLLKGAVVHGKWCTDGGVTDRIGYAPWSDLRGARTTWVHVIERTLGAPEEPLDAPHIVVVRSPRSGAKLWSLGPFWEQMDQTRKASEDQLRRIEGLS